MQASSENSSEWGFRSPARGSWRLPANGCSGRCSLLRLGRAFQKRATLGKSLRYHHALFKGAVEGVRDSHSQEGTFCSPRAGLVPVFRGPL